MADRPRATTDRAFPTAAILVIAYAIAMAYVESAVVVYLRRALAVDVSTVFPLQDPRSLGGLASIEVGREAATVVMLGAVGLLTGRSRLERLAWFAVAFGAWDIAYYGWLWVFSGWPTSLSTWDLLFLIPAPWAGPVWAPCVVSLALVAFGLIAARQLRRGLPVRVGQREIAVAVVGGLVVVLSFLANAGLVLAGGTPTSWPWPVFVVGMALAVLAATWAFRGSRTPLPKDS